jgi:hypothetical protein
MVQRKQIIVNIVDTKMDIYKAKITNITPSNTGVGIACSFRNLITGDESIEYKIFELEKATEEYINNWREARKIELQSIYEYRKSLEAQVVAKTEELQNLIDDEI